MDRLKAHAFQLETLPPQSPDLNILEHLWAATKAKMVGIAYTDRQTLWKYFEANFQACYAAHYNALVSSMPARVLAVIDAKGGNTRY